MTNLSVNTPKRLSYYQFIISACSTWYQKDHTSRQFPNQSILILPHSRMTAEIQTTLLNIPIPNQKDCAWKEVSGLVHGNSFLSNKRLQQLFLQLHLLSCLQLQSTDLSAERWISMSKLHCSPKWNNDQERPQFTNGQEIHLALIFQSRHYQTVQACIQLSIFFTWSGDSQVLKLYSSITWLKIKSCFCFEMLSKMRCRDPTKVSIEWHLLLLTLHEDWHQQLMALD